MNGNNNACALYTYHINIHEPYRWKFKHPGRVGDSPLIGGGLYCDGAVGAAVATGDGEEVQYVCTVYAGSCLIHLPYHLRWFCHYSID